MDSNQQIESLCQSIEKNQDLILKVLEGLGEVFGNLADLSGYLYDGQDAFPLQIYRSFRRTFQSSRSVLDILESYQPNSEQFQLQKKELIGQQIKWINTIVSFQSVGEAVNRSPPVKMSRDHDKNNHLSRIDYLQNEISALNHLLQTNNQDFQNQIQNYNHHLFELKQTIQHYQQQLQKADQREVFIDSLENKMQILREERERDQMVIEQAICLCSNMARKIRFFQKERGGREAFFSPRSMQSTFSPEVAKSLAIARTNMSAYRKVD